MRKLTYRTRSNSSQRGMFLLEALIGILIFSMGILAVVGLVASAIANVSDANYRTDASLLANRIIGEMWVDRGNLASYQYSSGTPPSVLTNWVNAVNNTLPGASTIPPTIAVAGNTVTVTISWKPPRATTAHIFSAVALISNP
jgi:type IV pilus assembly protein PilV